MAARGRILIMDDEVLIRNVVGRILTRIGYEVGFARDGTEAINLYRKAKESGHPFDIVFMDLTIPGGMGGKETIQMLYEADPEVKAIVSSGDSKDPIMIDYQQYGFSGVVAKPYKIEQLSRVVRSVMKMRE